MCYLLNTLETMVFSNVLLKFRQDNWFKITTHIMLTKATSWRKRLDARLPPLGSRVRVSFLPCGFRGGRNGVWVGFSGGFSRFSLPWISFHHFSTLISSISFHFIRPCDDASGVVGRHPCSSSLDPTLCWTRVEDIYIYLYLKRHMIRLRDKFYITFFLNSVSPRN